MKSLLAIAFASVYGLCMRVLFGFFSSFFSIMSVTFMVFIPFIIGYLTVFLIAKKRISRWAAFFWPWLTSFVLFLVTLFLDLEGLVCWVMIFPFFAVVAGFGGLVANSRPKLKENYRQDASRSNTLQISALVILPLFLAFAEGDKSLSPHEMSISKEVVVNAPAVKVWKEITGNTTVPATERGTFWTDAFSMPHHLQTTLDTLAVGGHRRAIYEKGLVFDETITRIEPEKLLVLKIHADPTKIPPTIMDEHIAIGGKHVDMLEDRYQIQTLANGSTKLTLTSQFVITTPFNWYSGIWAKWLMADILQDELDQIQKRIAGL